MAGNRTAKTLENGTATDTGHDHASRLLSVDHRLGATSFQRFDYVLNAVGNRTSRTESGTGFQPVTDAYGYDAIDQVTQVQYGSDTVNATTQRQTNYAYDPAGNRLSVIEDADGTGPNAPVTTPYTANDVNQYTVIDSLAAPQHDLNGSLTQFQPKLGGPVWTYTYDAQNRLTGGSDGAAVTFSFAYDARNRCVARTINGTTTLNLYDGWNLIEERDATDTQLARYLHGAGTDELLARITPTGATYYHHDALGSVTRLTDDTGALVESYTYDIYGQPTIKGPTGTVLLASAVGNRFQFTGREWFAELGLQDNRNRYYQPEIGRWLSRDPIGEEGGVNLYGYAENQPANLSDPLGLSSLPLAPLNPANAAIVAEAMGNTAASISLQQAAARAAIAAAAAASISVSQSPKDPCKGLRKQFNEHLKKLQEYIQNPDAHDNLNFLKQPFVKARPELREKIIDGRIKELQKQIDNFKRQLDDCQKGN